MPEEFTKKSLSIREVFHDREFLLLFTGVGIGLNVAGCCVLGWLITYNSNTLYDALSLLIGGIGVLGTGRHYLNKSKRGGLIE